MPNQRIVLDIRREETHAFQSSEGSDTIHKNIMFHRWLKNHKYIAHKRTKMLMQKSHTFFYVTSMNSEKKEHWIYRKAVTELWFFLFFECLFLFRFGCPTHSMNCRLRYIFSFMYTYFFLGRMSELFVCVSELRNVMFLEFTVNYINGIVVVVVVVWCITFRLGLVVRTGTCDTII